MLKFLSLNPTKPVGIQRRLAVVECCLYQRPTGLVVFKGLAWRVA